MGLKWWKIIGDIGSIGLLIPPDALDVEVLIGDIRSGNISKLEADLAKLEADYPAAQAAIIQLINDIKS